MQNRYYVEHHSLPKLEDAGIHAFKEYVFDHVKDKVISALLQEIQRDREGEAVDRRLLRTCVEILEAVGHENKDVYINHLETPLLEATRSYYESRAQDWVVEEPTPRYLQLAEDVLVSEAERVQAYLLESTESKLLRVAEEVLLRRQEAALLEKEGSGLEVMLRDQRDEDLARLFRLFARVDGGLAPIAKSVREHLQEQGMRVVRQREADFSAAGGKEAQGDSRFVQSLMELHDRAVQLVQGPFQGHTLFQKALKEAFEVFVNQEVRCRYSNTEMIAGFCDRILRTGGTRMSDDEAERALEKVVQLFAFIIDKDRFGEIYRNQLAKRLLSGRSASADSERSMLSKLKMRCGAQYTSKMEGMLSDLNVAAQHARDYREWCRGEGCVRNDK